MFSPSASSSSPPALPPSSSSVEADRCAYSSYWSTQCLNGSCESQQRRFRQCEGRPREELVTKQDGSERWVKADEQTGRGQAEGEGRALSIDVAFPDPFVSLFDEVRAQTQLMGQAFREAFAQQQPRWPQSASPRAAGGERSPQGGGGGGPGVGDGVSGESRVSDDDLLRGSLLSGLVDVLHGLSRDAVDALFDRSGASSGDGRGEAQSGSRSASYAPFVNAATHRPHSRPSSPVV